MLFAEQAKQQGVHSTITPGYLVTNHGTVAVCIVIAGLGRIVHLHIIRACAAGDAVLTPQRRVDSRSVFLWRRRRPSHRRLAGFRELARVSSCNWLAINHSMRSLCVCSLLGQRVSNCTNPATGRLPVHKQLHMYIRRIYSWSFDSPPSHTFRGVQLHRHIRGPASWHFVTGSKTRSFRCWRWADCFECFAGPVLTGNGSR